MSFDNNPTAVRVYALQEAVKIASGTPGITDDAKDVIGIAEMFLSFLNGGDASTSASGKTAPSSAPAPAASKPKSTKTAPTSDSTVSKPVKTASASKPEPTAEEIFEERKTKIGEKVAASLAADKRAEAVAIMEGYGAKSVTQLAQGTADLAEILAKFDEMLLSA